MQYQVPSSVSLQLSLACHITKFSVTVILVVTFLSGNEFFVIVIPFSGSAVTVIVIANYVSGNELSHPAQVMS